MTKRRKPITGLKAGEIITNPSKYFTKADRRQIIEKYLNRDSSKAAI